MGVKTPQNEEGRLPLSHISVIDLTQARSGPTAVRHLADWGANVVTIQQVGDISEDATGSRDSSDRQNLHRNKRMIQLNLKSAAGRAVFMRMVERADVVVENFRPDVKQRLGIAWEDVRKVNPRIVYGSISGFGQTGPYSDRPGLDPVAQALGGLMSITGEPGRGPMRVGIAINDTSAGDLLALAISFALIEREVTGEGRWVHTSLLETQLFILDFQGARWLMEGQNPGQVGNFHPTGTPSGAYQTTDGWIVIATGSPRHWLAFCDLIGKPEWKEKKEWKTSRGRTKDREAITSVLADKLKTAPTQHWIEAFETAGIPCARVNSVKEAFEDPQSQHVGMAAQVHHPKYGDCAMVASPLNFDGLSKDIRIVTRDPGEDTDAVLSELGYSADEIAGLRADGVL